MTVATTPRELPILMHTRSIEGIEAGRKRQTRRILKPQPDRAIAQPRVGEYFQRPCPYGEPGDLLWVRETWTADFGDAFSDNVGAWWHEMPKSLRTRKAVHYLYYAAGEAIYHCPKADGLYPNESFRSTWEPSENDLVGRRWQPSIHMPKWACRHWLRNTGIRVERVQDISEADAIAEGVEPYDADASMVAEHLIRGSMVIDRFARLWDETNGAGAWERNDWVWVIDFERTEAPSR